MARIKMLTGVVEVGLFCHMAKAAYFGNEVCWIFRLKLRCYHWFRVLCRMAASPSSGITERLNIFHLNRSLVIALGYLYICIGYKTKSSVVCTWRTRLRRMGAPSLKFCSRYRFEGQHDSEPGCGVAACWLQSVISDRYFVSLTGILLVSDHRIVGRTSCTPGRTNCYHKCIHSYSGSFSAFWNSRTRLGLTSAVCN